MTTFGKLEVRWVSLKRAREYVADHHRHLPRIQGGVLALGAFDGGRLCGVAILGRPTARLFDTGERMELTRCATDGTPNAPSALYGRARRVAQALGVDLVTYTREDEPGSSLRGAGWTDEGLNDAAGGRSDGLPRRRWSA